MGRIIVGHHAIVNSKQGRFYVGARGTGPPNVGQAPPPNILVPTEKIRNLKI